MNIVLLEYIISHWYHHCMITIEKYGVMSIVNNTADIDEVILYPAMHMDRFLIPVIYIKEFRVILLEEVEAI